MNATAINGPDTRVTPIQPANRVRLVAKQDNGDLVCTNYAGRVFTVPAGEPTLQAFVVWTMAYGDEL